MYESSIFGHENTSKKTGKALKKGKFMSVRSIFSYFKSAMNVDLELGKIVTQNTLCTREGKQVFLE